MHPSLTPHQAAVARHFLAEQEAQRRHVVVALSGAHAYGFPSVDSDVDLKAVHVDPPRALLGLAAAPGAAELLLTRDGVELDYSSNELRPVLQGVLAGNGNYVERLLGRHALAASDVLADAAPLVRAVLSRRVARHYAGFSRQQRAQWDAGGRTSAKRLLYVLRTLATGLHLLRTAEVETDVTAFAADAAFAGVLELVAHKRAAERAALPADVAQHWAARVDALHGQLAAALDGSVLPPEPPAAAVRRLEAWLLAVRRDALLAPTPPGGAGSE